MIKLKTHKDISSISVNGKEYLIKDGILEIEKHLFDNIKHIGFELHTETQEKKQIVNVVVENIEEQKTSKKTKVKKG